MNKGSLQTIHKRLGGNNLLLVVADGYAPVQETATPHHFLAELALTLADQLNAYAVINTKYKREIMDLADIRAVKSRPRVLEAFLVPIRQFKDEIAGNGLLPLVVILQTLPPEDQPEAMLLLGYGQGERGAPDLPHRPTLSPSLLSKIRMAIEDQHLQTTLAPTASAHCGRETHHVNQLFRQREHLDGYFDPEVRSLVLSIRRDLVQEPQTAQSIAHMLAAALTGFCQAMSLVRTVDLANIDAASEVDRQFIFRLPGDDHYADLLRESYIDELAESIDRSGLLHPLVLLKKNDGRYRILCGFRRFQALKRLGRDRVEAKVYEEGDFSPEDFFQISLAENTRRRNLNPVEIGNFLESASTTLELNNTELAQRFGAILGIGKPGQKVSHSTIHKYRKVNQIRLRGESPEIISDVVNEKLPFSVAAEILAPIRNARDRDSLYLHIIRAMTPTRPQLTKIVSLLNQLASSLFEALTLPEVQRAIDKARTSSQPAATLVRLLSQARAEKRSPQLALVTAKVEDFRRTCFGDQSSKNDFNIVPTSAKRNEMVINLRLKRGEERATLKKLIEALEQQDLFAQLWADSNR